jgi:hypothetical protein
VQGNGASLLHQRGHLRNNLLRLGNVDENQAGRGQIEGFFWQSCRDSVPLTNFHIPDLLVREKFSSELDGFFAQFDSNNGTRRADAAGQKFEAPLCGPQPISTAREPGFNPI